MGQVAPHHLLGDADAPRLILMAGPVHDRIKEIIRVAGIAFRFVHISQVEDVEALKAGISIQQDATVVFAALPEIEGTLDRSAFQSRVNPMLIDLAYAADRVIYVGTTGAAMVHPMASGTTLRVRHGNLSVSQQLDVVAAGETVVGLTVDRL